jgi:hypothetical protein
MGRGFDVDIFENRLEELLKENLPGLEEGEQKKSNQA